MTSGERLFLVGYLSSAIGALVAVSIAYAYARSYDPWLTPRWTHYMIIWWGVSRPVFVIATLGVAAGLLSTVCVRELRHRWQFWFAVAVFSLSAVLSHP